jgi:hypothetical protein
MFHGKQWHSQTPRPRNSCVPSSRSSQYSGLCRETLLVSSRLGGGAATGHLMTHHQEDEQERRSNQNLRLRVCRPDIPSQSVLYISGRNIEGALPVVGQLGGGLRLSPQRLRGDKAIESKRLFSREHVIHGPAQLVGEDSQRFGFAVLVFEFGEILFPGLALADEEDRSFGKGPA